MQTAKLLTAILVLLAGAALAQMGGGGAPSRGMPSNTSNTGMGQSSMGGMHGSQSGMGSMGQGGATMTPAQRRQLLHTTSMQDQKYQASARAMAKVQGAMSRMQSHANTASAASASSSSLAGNSSNAQAGSDSGDDLSSDLQDLDQSNDDFASSLNSDQQAVVASKLKDLQKKTKEMQTLADQVKSELNNPQADPKIAREHMKKLDKLSKEVAKQQHEVANALGISA
jgi:hypothetical protein